MNKKRVHIFIAPELIKKLDEYRLKLVAQPTRNAVITDACLDYLRARGIEVKLENGEDIVNI